MSEQISRMTPEVALDGNGDPVSGAQAYFYYTGTTTPESVYTDAGLGTAHPHPLIADAYGVFPEVFHAADHAIKVVVTDSLGGTLYTIDPVPITASAASAANVMFTPVSDNTATDVQQAIANNTVLAVANRDSLANESQIAVTGGSGNNYTITSPEPITAYAIGQSFLVQFDRDNTSAVTLNVDGVGAKAIKEYKYAATPSSLVAGELLQHSVYRMVYDGTQFILLDVQARNNRRGLVEKSSSAENIAGTETNKFPSVAGVKEVVDTFNPVLASCYFVGTAGTPTPLGAKNVSSITDNGAGNYTINFTTPLSDTTYKVLITVDTAGVRRYSGYDNKLVGSVDILTLDTAGAGVDLDEISVVIIE